jgi:hypothetical protein
MRGIPSHYYISRDYQYDDPQNGKTHTIQKALELSVLWKPLYSTESVSDIGYHPAIIRAFDISRHYHKNRLHRWGDYPAIRIKKLRVTWNAAKECQDNNLTFRPGPYEITINNYREYWHEGKLDKVAWDTMFFKWWSGFATIIIPHRDLEIISRSGHPCEKEIIDLLQNPNKPVTPLNNQFFNDTTDEFLFMDIIQRVNK